MDNTEGLAQAMNESAMHDRTKSLEQRVAQLEEAVRILTKAFSPALEIRL